MRLIEEYTEASSAFFRATVRLREANASVVRPSPTLSVFDGAKCRCSQARLALFAHKDKHGC